MLNAVHVICCLVILYTCFSRVVDTDHETRAEIRWCIACLGMAALSYAVAPFFWGVDINPASCTFVLAVAALQVFATRLWRNGVPPQFLKLKPQPQPQTGPGQASLHH